MKVSRIVAAVACSLLSITMAHAETYDGVHTMSSTASRLDKEREAIATTRAGNPYGDAASAGPQRFTSTADRGKVQAEAVAKNNDRLSSIDRRAFYRDEIPQAFKKPRVSFSRQAGL